MLCFGNGQNGVTTFAPMANATPKYTEIKTVRQPYDSIPRPEPRIIDPCTRSTDLVIPGMNKRIEDSNA